MNQEKTMRMAAVMVVCLAVLGCDSRQGSDAGGVDAGDPNVGNLFAEFQYATRCDATGGCAPGDHDVCGFDGALPCDTTAPNADLRCTAVERDGIRTLSFSAQQGAGRIEVSGLDVPFDGGPAMGEDCLVTVEEGSGTYSGACGSSTPSEAQPCQITDVVFYDDMGNPTFEADLFCQFLANQANPALQIEVTARGASGPAFGGTPPMSICATASPAPPACTPARIRFANCDGLTCTPDTCATP